MRSPKLVIFDLSDVLIKGMEGCEYPLAKELGLPVEQVSQQLFSYDYHSFYIGKINENDCLSDIIKKYQWNISVTKFKKLLRNNFKEIIGSRKIIKAVNEKYATVLLSVNPIEWATYFLEHFDLQGLFNRGIYFSYQIGFTKRQKESFLYILQKYHVAPEDVLLVDDSKRNLGIAAEIGIRGIRFMNPEQLKKELVINKIL